MLAFAVYMFYLNRSGHPDICNISYRASADSDCSEEINEANKARVDGTRKMSNLIDETVSGIHEIDGNASYRVEGTKSRNCGSFVRIRLSG